MIDEKGTLLVVGQHFTERDSINAASTLAKISPSGEMISVKHVGRTGRYKGNFKKQKVSLHSHEDRLVQIFKTRDNRIFAFGYKTFPVYQRKLWIVELNENLDFLQDTTYMNLPVSDIGKMAAFDSPNGWYLITRQYYEERELSRYRIAILEFNNNLACIDSTTKLVADENGKKACMYWMNGVSVFEDNLLFAGQGAITYDTLDEDLSEKRGYIMQFNMKTKEIKILHVSQAKIEPQYAVSIGSEICILYVNYTLDKYNLNTPRHLLVCYDSNFNELWRDEQQLSKLDKPQYLISKKGKWHALGVMIESTEVMFYEVVYNAKGSMIKKNISKGGSDREFVMEIAGSKNSKYRLYVDNAWRIDKLKK